MKSLLTNEFVSIGAAAWWSMASQMAAQDYLARLHVAGGGGGGATSTSSSSAGFPTPHGYPTMSAADSLLASYASAMNATHSKSSNSSAFLDRSFQPLLDASGSFFVGFFFGDVHGTLWFVLSGPLSGFSSISSGMVGESFLVQVF